MIIIFMYYYLIETTIFKEYILSTCLTLFFFENFNQHLYLIRNFMIFLRENLTLCFLCRIFFFLKF